MQTTEYRKREYKKRSPQPAPSADRVPPQALDVERTILGSMLIDSAAIDVVLEILDNDDYFYSDAHVKIFICMKELATASSPVDIITVSEKLRNKGWMEDVGAEAYLSELAENVATSGNMQYYASIVREKATLRHLISVAAEITTDCFSSDREAQEVLDTAEYKIFDISKKRVASNFESIGTLLTHTIAEADRYGKGISGIRTGFTDLDKLTTGLQKGDLVVVGGRPSMGKTAFCLSMALHIAVHDKRPTAVFSLEMSKAQLSMRILCSEANINMHSLRSGTLSKVDYSKLSPTAIKLSETPLYIDDTPGINALQLRAMARRIKSLHGLELIIVDYLQLMAPNIKTESVQQDVSQISRSLKSIARELDVPVIALSQLSRKVVDRSRDDRRPQLSDLRDSGAIEQDADVVMFVHREGFYSKDPIDDDKAEIIVEKQRNGPTGIVNLNFVKANATFRNPAAGEHNVPGPGVEEDGS
ncbi:MAG: replicative DNA helicase [Chitinispirillales bacterium]|nr:replicative DNA helicase [Chitinispirillales bacterium]